MEELLLANKKTKPLVTIDTRQIRRSRLKNSLGTSQIAGAWREAQIMEHGGFQNWFAMFWRSRKGKAN